MTTYTVTLQEDEAGDLILPLPQELLDQNDWKIGSQLNWADNGDGSFTLSKVETELVMVETVHHTLVKYLVEVPKGKKAWALDTVTLEEAGEFSSVPIGSNITSHRVITLADAQAQLNEDLHSLQSLGGAEEDAANFITPWRGSE